jgi:hypothetical protein
MGQEKMASSHNQINDGSKKGDFLGQKKLILGCNVMNYGTNRVEDPLILTTYGQLYIGLTDTLKPPIV